MGLIRDLGAGPVGLDTAIFIYLIERNPRWLPLVAPLFEAIDRGRTAAVTSALTLLETLVVPYRAGDLQLAARYERLLTTSRGLQFVPLDAPILRGAAMIRARASIQTPDALQLAAALSAGCPVFLTNDRALPSVAGIRVLQLSRYESSAR